MEKQRKKDGTGQNVDESFLPDVPHVVMAAVPSAFDRLCAADEVLAGTIRPTFARGNRNASHSPTSGDQLALMRRARSRSSFPLESRLVQPMTTASGD